MERLSAGETEIGEKSMDKMSQGRIDLAELKEKHEEIIEMVCVDAKDLLFTTNQNSSVRSYMEQEFDLEEAYPF